MKKAADTFEDQARKIEKAIIWLGVLSLLLTFGHLIAGLSLVQDMENSALDSYAAKQAAYTGIAKEEVKTFLRYLSHDLELSQQDLRDFLKNGNTEKTDSPNREALLKNLDLQFNRIQHLGVNDIAVTDPAGKLILEASRPNLSAPSVKDLSGLLNRNSVFANFFCLQYRDSVGKGSGVHLAGVPILDKVENTEAGVHGDFIGMILLSLTLDSLYNYLEQRVQVSEGGMIALFGPDLETIWHLNSPSDSGAPHSLTAAFESRKQLLNSLQTGRQAKWLVSAPENGEEYLATSTPLYFGQVRWVLATFSPRATAIAGLRTLYRKGSVIVTSNVILILLGASLSIWVAFSNRKRLKRALDLQSERLEKNHRHHLEVERRHRKELDRAGQLATVGELAASVAHEIRNPIFGIRSALELISEEHDVKIDGTDLFPEIFIQLDRVTRTIENLIRFSLPQNVHFKETRLHATIRQVATFYEAQFEKQKIDLKLYLEADNDLADADEELIKQVLVNLLNNAGQAIAPASGQIVIRTRNRDLSEASLEILISDSGKGISAEVCSRIFKPFFTTRAKGSGLGLSLSRSIMNRHSGDLSVESEYGKGSTFTMSLPISRVQPDSDEGADPCKP